MDKLSEEHIAWLRRQNDRSDKTVISRLRVLRAVNNAGTITRDDLEAWWESRAQLATGSRAVDLSHLKQFYAWCQAYDRRVDDPTARIRRPRVKNRIPRKASKADIDTLLDSALTPDLRRAFLLGCYAGLRVAESAALDWSDVSEDTNTIVVRSGKGDKDREVDISPLLIDWLGRRHRGNVVTAGNEPYTAAALQRKLNRAIKTAGLDITTHALRHRWGMVAYQSSGDLLAVAEMMGHASVNTTKIYAQASSDVKKKIASAVMR
jgi:site-specific recombinase XerD